MLAHVLVIYFGCACVGQPGEPPGPSIYVAIIVDELHTACVLEASIQILETYTRLFPERAGAAELACALSGLYKSRTRLALG